MIENIILRNVYLMYKIIKFVKEFFVFHLFDLSVKKLMSRY